MHLTRARPDHLTSISFGVFSFPGNGLVVPSKPVNSARPSELETLPKEKGGSFPSFSRPENCAERFDYFSRGVRSRGKLDDWIRRILNLNIRDFISPRDRRRVSAMLPFERGETSQSRNLPPSPPSFPPPPSHIRPSLQMNWHSNWHSSYRQIWFIPWPGSAAVEPPPLPRQPRTVNRVIGRDRTKFGKLKRL